ncbi:hypothetical protein SAMN05428949_5269 [Chitinophaga sp. YR627]|uniref:hypothetical protein n=1 Tax=Chitinophaga sp. YR627 TaxID=1881041 RepID=UPI0008EADF64|nr:hypothetical protein [Chitinophaga sp. YR627]SFO46670.1 hypothetical protein SAMN05428949_5269 [Chitinophaga sp. YR627]
MTSSTQPKLINNDEASLRFNLEQFENFGETSFQHVILLDGNTAIDGDLDQEWTEKTLATLGVTSGSDETLILVNGNLQVAGTIKPAADTFPFLLVIGNVRCEVIDTQVRILLKLGNKEEAYQIVKRILRTSPDFVDFQDFTTNADYLTWLEK